MQIKKIDCHIIVTLSLDLTLHYHLVRLCKGVDGPESRGNTNLRSSTEFSVNRVYLQSYRGGLLSFYGTPAEAAF